MRRLQSENQVLKRQLRKTHHEREIVGKSEEMTKVFKMLDKVADTESTILVYGESGTGKELIAREIHYRSHRCHGPFVSINCGALPKDLLESNLFGHIRGSFTGAIKDQQGLFTVSENGTFFLDEVGEMAAATQVKLLRALQEREIIPVGGTKPIKINVRLIAATNADLEREVAEGRFRTDLFYRLNVIPVFLPPLRARRDDIPLLVDHFLRRLVPDGRLAVDAETLKALLRYDWPGNVRELENVIERAVILCEGNELRLGDLPEKVVRRAGAQGEPDHRHADHDPRGTGEGVHPEGAPVHRLAEEAGQRGPRHQPLDPLPQAHRLRHRGEGRRDRRRTTNPPTSRTAGCGLSRRGFGRDHPERAVGAVSSAPCIPQRHCRTVHARWTCPARVCSARPCGPCRGSRRVGCPT